MPHWFVIHLTNMSWVNQSTLCNMSQLKDTTLGKSLENKIKAFTIRTLYSKPHSSKSHTKCIISGTSWKVSWGSVESTGFKVGWGWGNTSKWKNKNTSFLSLAVAEFLEQVIPQELLLKFSIRNSLDTVWMVGGCKGKNTVQSFL